MPELEAADATWRSERPPPVFACLVEHQTERVVVSVHGELDVASAPVLERRLLELFNLPLSRVIVDASQLTFIDSAGLRVLVRAHAAAEERSVDFEIEGASCRMQGMLSRAGVAALPAPGQ